MWRVNFFKPTFFDNCFWGFFFFCLIFFQKVKLFSQFMDDFYTQILNPLPTQRIP